MGHLVCRLVRFLGFHVLVVGRVMMINPMLISWAVVSSLSAAEAMSACLAMAVKTLERGLVWS
jgi:hypothetical protein